MRNQRAVLAALLAVLAPDVSGAQSRDLLEARRLSTAAAFAQLQAAQARVQRDSAARAVLPQIRAYAGMELRADSTQLPAGFLRAFDRAFEISRDNARRLFGNIADSLFAGSSVSIAPNNTEGRPLRFVTLASEGPIGSGRVTEGADPLNVDQISLRFDMWYGQAAGARLPPHVRAWVSNYIPLQPQQRRVYAEAYLTLSSSPLPDARACLNGNLMACQLMLATTPRGDTVSALLPADPGLLHATSGMAPETRRCFAQRTVVACRNVIAPSDGGVHGRILARFADRATSFETRREVLLDALNLGGRDAFARLITMPSENVATALSNASRGSTDVLASRWLIQMQAARPRSPSPNGAELFSGIALCGLLLGASIGRRP